MAPKLKQYARNNDAEFEVVKQRTTTRANTLTIFDKPQEIVSVYGDMAPLLVVIEETNKAEYITKQLPDEYLA